MSLIAVFCTSKDAQEKSNLTTGEFAELVGANSDGTRVKRARWLWAEPRYGGSTEAIRETYRLAKHGTTQDTSATVSWTLIRTSATASGHRLVNRTCHLWVRVAGSCQAGEEAGLVVPGM